MQGLIEQHRLPLITHLNDVVPTIKNTFGVIRIGVFGSVVRGEETGKSDFDVLVELAEGYKTLKNFVALAEYLEALFNRKVDLVTVEGLDPYIRPYVEKEVVWVEG